ncbi:hypothetical protein ETB97_003847 [Aspergillus alliaceus]|uniref:Uncharacterized protein n=1 Tax=Petromyces alliaceus TaxID=209559 RepID=A0A5N6G0X4_PETAA|nr:acyl-CoA N-acyltransferase [Aspergillus alliaceus]KAB8235155.1 acyl-CoA N-acyltransferase [Aspergillus alliaceus]KAF5858738.1 hypothetical protein ETB97_003847 [Aspergillus burnettii]
MSPTPTPLQIPALDGLNPFTRPLTPSDIQSCVTVENAAFIEQERCSEEKFEYRLHQTPGLCLGLFIKPNEHDTEQLIAHVIANRSSSRTIAEGSMQMPPDWQSRSSSEAVVVDGEVIGDDPHGMNVAVHSVGVMPRFQGTGVGKSLLRVYVEYIRNSGVRGERIILICHDYLIRFYESAGFEVRGPSECLFAGGGWFDMELVV